MLALATRFEKGRISAMDCVRIIGAGLRGAGYEIANNEVANMHSDGGRGGVRRHRGEVAVGDVRRRRRARQRECRGVAWRPFPWDDVMAVGFGVLGLAPSVLWSMTMKEFEAAVRGRIGPGAGEALSRGRWSAGGEFPDRQGVGRSERSEVRHLGRQSVGLRCVRYAHAAHSDLRRGAALG